MDSAEDDDFFFWASSLRDLVTFAAEAASSPLVGSSRNNTFGAFIMAMAAKRETTLLSARQL